MSEPVTHPPGLPPHSPSPRPAALREKVAAGEKRSRRRVAKPHSVPNIQMNNKTRDSAPVC
jgi:hypothetical protein